MAVQPTTALFTPEAFANPYPLYHAVRAEEPVSFNRLLPGWVAISYDTVAAVLRDPRMSARRFFPNDPVPPGLEAVAEELRASRHFRSLWILFLDPPEHTRLRGLVSKAFTPAVVARMRDQIQRLVDSLLDQVQARGEMDLIRDLAYPLPATVISVMLGLPPEDRDRFKSWSDDMAASFTSFAAPDIVDRVRRSQRSQQALADYFHGLVEQRRKRPSGDLLSALVAAEEHADVLSEEELLASCVLLLFAGHETTTNLIGNGLLALLRHPDQLQRLRDEPALIASAVEELLRYDSPVQFTSRVTPDEVELGGKRIPKGELITLMIGAANRDPAQFPDSDRLDLARRDNRHLSFAHGVHFCLGAPLARLEGQIAISTVLRRLPRLRLVEQAPPRWGTNLILRGLESFPVRF